MFTFHCALIALYFGCSCSHLPNSLCSWTLALVLASAWNLPLAFPLVMILGADARWGWSGHFPLPCLFGEEGGHDDSRRPLASTSNWNVSDSSQPHCTHLACGRFRRHEPVLELSRNEPVLAQADEPTPWSPSSMVEWCMRLLLLLNWWEHPQAWLPGVYMPKHTVSGCASTYSTTCLLSCLPPCQWTQKSLPNRSWVRLPCLLCNMVLHGYIHTFDADIKMFSSHPLYTNISGKIFCACFPQKLSLTLGLGCPAHLSRRWSPAPLAQPPCT